MNFASNIFIFYFFPISLITYFLTNKFLPKIRDYVLLLCSFAFYAWAGLKFAFLLLFYILVVFLLGKLISKRKNRLLLVFSILIAVAILIYYKYTHFIIVNLDRFFKMTLTPIEIVAPLGISFITFETISYFVDIYRDKTEYECSFIGTASFILFFPKIISGPIVLWKDYREEFKNRKICFDNVIVGVERVIIGLAKKVLIADVLAEPVTTVFSRYLGWKVDVQSCWLVILAYAIQIYFDFSGYSDIALGLSKIMGLSFKENFDFPYRSTSVTEFWRKWHISLGTFFREYVYIPLGGNRKHVLINLFIVFVLTGIWHGSSWPLILWGILHGIVVVIERVIMKKSWYQKIPKFIKWAFTFTFVSMTWTLFNIDFLPQTIIFAKYLLGLEEFGHITFSYRYVFNFRVIVAMVIGLAGALMGNKIPQLLNEKINNSKVLTIIKYVLLFILFYIVLIFVVNSTYRPFVYFKF